MNTNEFCERYHAASSKLDQIEIDHVLISSLEPLTSCPNANTTGAYNLIIVMEELGELTQQISKFIRGKNNRDDLLQELADTYLGLRYVQLVCNITDAEVNKAINVKTERQRTRNIEREN